MEEQLSPLAVTHLLQHTLRSLCNHENSQWVYAVFWRILPRNYPPPKWDSQGGAYDRSRGNRRNWILVWEDGFCNFAASTAAEMSSGDGPASSSAGQGNFEYQQYQGLQPELFFKMSHEIYNYGEGLIGKVAADHSHKWIYKEPNEQEINFLSAWHNSADSHPRTWEAQFQSGIKTIALIAVREGVIQLGSVQKVVEDLSYIVLLRKKLSYIESIPGVLLPHPSSSAYPFHAVPPPPDNTEPWHLLQPPPPPPEFIQDHHHRHHHHHHLINHPMLRITPSMSSLEALLSKLPSVVPPTQQHHQQQFVSTSPPPPNVVRPMEMEKVAKEEIEDDDDDDNNQDHNQQYYYHNKNATGESSSTTSSMASYYNYQHFNHQYHGLNVTTSNTHHSGF